MSSGILSNTLFQHLLYDRIKITRIPGNYVGPISYLAVPISKRMLKSVLLECFIIGIPTNFPFKALGMGGDFVLFDLEKVFVIKCLV